MNLHLLTVSQAFVSFCGLYSPIFTFGYRPDESFRFIVAVSFCTYRRSPITTIGDLGRCCTCWRGCARACAYASSSTQPHGDRSLSSSSALPYRRCVCPGEMSSPPSEPADFADWTTLQGIMRSRVKEGSARRHEAARVRVRMVKSILLHNERQRGKPDTRYTYTGDC